MASISAALAVALTLAGGQVPSGLTERRQQLLNYELTLPRANQLIAALDAMTKYVVSLPDFAERMRKQATLMPAEQLAQIERDPKAAAILKANNLSARDYLVGVPALRMALMVAQGLPQNDKIVASPANVAFAKSHLAELKAKMDTADGESGRR